MTKTPPPPKPTRRIAKRPYSFKPDTHSLYKDHQHDQWTMNVSNYVARASFIGLVRLRPDGLISSEVAEPDADVWFLLKIHCTDGPQGAIIFNREVFYPVRYDNSERLHYISTGFNSLNMRVNKFTSKDCVFLNLFVDAVLDKVL